MRRLRYLLALAAALGGMALATTLAGHERARAAGDCSVSDADLAMDGEEQAFLTLINDYRAANGAGPLAVSPSLTRAAAWKSRDMATNNYFSHFDQFDGYRTVDERIVDCGYPWTNLIPYGENLAGGTATATAAFDAWKQSVNHNTAMLNSDYVVIGIARAYNSASTWRWYWTTDFGGVPDGPIASVTATPTPAAAATPTPAPTGDTIAPGVSLAAPQDGQAVSGRVAIKASAVDNVKVARVTFLVDWAAIKSDSSAPYSVTWNSQKASPGTHLVVARAYDTSGNWAEDVRSVSVTR